MINAIANGYTNGYLSLINKNRGKPQVFDLVFLEDFFVKQRYCVFLHNTSVFYLVMQECDILNGFISFSYKEDRRLRMLCNPDLPCQRRMRPKQQDGKYLYPQRCAYIRGCEG